MWVSDLPLPTNTANKSRLKLSLKMMLSYNQNGYVAALSLAGIGHTLGVKLIPMIRRDRETHIIQAGH